jgi:hypothetical protein
MKLESCKLDRQCNIKWYLPQEDKNDTTVPLTCLLCKDAWNISIYVALTV